MQDKISNAVTGIVRTPPYLFIGKGFDTGPQSGPVLLQQFLAGKLQKQCAGIPLCIDGLQKAFSSMNYFSTAVLSYLWYPHLDALLGTPVPTNPAIAPCAPCGYGSSRD